MTRPTITGIAALILTIFFAFVSTASAAPKSGSGASEKAVVASVGEEPITLESFYAFIKELPANMQMQARTNKAMFLEALIQRWLIVRYATENDFHGGARVKMQMERARREILIAEAVRRIEERSKPKAAQIRADRTSRNSLRAIKSPPPTSWWRLKKRRRIYWRSSQRERISPNWRSSIPLRLSVRTAGAWAQ